MKTIRPTDAHTMRPVRAANERIRYHPAERSHRISRRKGGVRRQSVRVETPRAVSAPRTPDLTKDRLPSMAAISIRSLGIPVRALRRLGDRSHAGRMMASAQMSTIRSRPLSSRSGRTWIGSCTALNLTSPTAGSIVTGGVMSTRRARALLPSPGGRGRSQRHRDGQSRKHPSEHSRSPHLGASLAARSRSLA